MSDPGNFPGFEDYDDGRVRIVNDCSPQCAAFGWASEARTGPTPSAHGLENDSVSLSAAELEATRAAIYEPLRDWETRLLILQPGHPGTGLQAELIPASLVHGRGVGLHDRKVGVEYEALSYCWGQGAKDCHIVCNGWSLPIMRNLYQALQLLRRPGKVRYLWVDAICINQGDDEEKSVQITNMLLIFRKARVVVVWLGEIESPGCRLALQLSIAKDRRPQEATDSPQIKICSAHVLA
jgi:hypothetical protein